MAETGTDKAEDIIEDKVESITKTRVIWGIVTMIFGAILFLALMWVIDGHISGFEIVTAVFIGLLFFFLEILWRPRRRGMRY